jgi:hypothetical protein
MVEGDFPRAVAPPLFVPGGHDPQSFLPLSFPFALPLVVVVVGGGGGRPSRRRAHGCGGRSGRRARRRGHDGGSWQCRCGHDSGRNKRNFIDNTHGGRARRRARRCGRIVPALVRGECACTTRSGEKAMDTIMTDRRRRRPLATAAGMAMVAAGGGGGRDDRCLAVGSFSSARAIAPAVV